MCILPFFEAPTECDDKGWALLYALRVAVVASLGAVVCYYCSFHWVEGVCNTLILLLSLFSVCYRSEHGLYASSICCTAFTYFVLGIFSLVRVLMNFLNPDTPPKKGSRLRPWQRDAYSAGIILDLIVFAIIFILSCWLFVHLRRLALARRGPDTPDEDEEDILGFHSLRGARGGGRGGRPNRGGYQQVGGNDDGDRQSYLQPNVGGARAHHGGNVAPAGSQPHGGGSDANQPGYDFHASQGYRLDGE